MLVWEEEEVGVNRQRWVSLSLTVAGAIVYGFSNIFVTASSPENLGTLFELILYGLDALNYKEHQNYKILYSTYPELNIAIVKI